MSSVEDRYGQDTVESPDADEPDAVEPAYVLEGRELFEHFRFVVDKGQKLLRVDKFLVERMEKTSRNRIQPGCRRQAA